MNSVSSLPATLYQVKVDYDTNDCFYELNKTIKLITLESEQDVESKTNLNVSLATSQMLKDLFSEIDFIAMDSDLNFLTKREFSWLQEHSFAIHLKDILLPEDLAEKIWLLEDLSTRDGNRSETIEMFKKELDPVKEEIRIGLQEFFKAD